MFIIIKKLLAAMPDKEKKAEMTPHDRLLEMASSRYPDRRYRGQIGQDGQEGQDDLEQAILDMLSESDARQKETDSKNEQLVKLFKNDPSAGEFLTRWVQSGDPRVALVEVFGDDLAELGTEEGRGKFAESLKGWRDRRAENDRMNAESDANWQKSLEDLDAWGDSKGLDNDKKAEVALRLIAIAANGLQNIYRPEDFDMVLKDMNYDSDVAAARQEGEVAGRNAKMTETRRARAKAGDMPPTLSGQGGRSIEAKPEEPEKPKSVWAGVE